jgi:predicted dehydrogenase
MRSSIWVQIMPTDLVRAASVPTARDTRNTTVLRVGLVGCGAFARFSLARYRLLPGVAIEAVADVDPAAAQRAAADLDAAVLEPEAILTAPGIDLVYIATPPSCHFPQALAALEAGKHVLVEKPLATTVADAETLAAAAAGRGLVCVANLVERYSPLADAVRSVIRSKLLGELVHGLFVNEAADEGLGVHHWFWDRDVSGGIFIEHGVHFFDLCSYWLGRGRVVTAARSIRPARTGLEGTPPVEEQVMCTCRYAGDASNATPSSAEPHAGVLFHFEHGFHQPSRLDRQEMRLVFERGELRLFDWVPTHGDLRGLLDNAAVESLAGMLPGSTVRRLDRYAGDNQHVRGRFRSFDASVLAEISFTSGMDKLDLYGQVISDLFADQLGWIRDRAHRRRLTEADGVASVAMACAADRMAMQGP